MQPNNQQQSGEPGWTYQPDSVITPDNGDATQSQQPQQNPDPSPQIQPEQPAQTQPAPNLQQPAQPAEMPTTPAQQQVSSPQPDPIQPTIDGDTVEWTASEYISHDREPAWYAGAASAATIVSFAVFIATRDWVATIAVALAALMVIIYSARKPKTRHYSLSNLGLSIDGTLHPYEKFKSFSVVEEGAIASIWLKPLKRLSPTITIYFAPDQEAEIVDFLSAYLPHEQRELDQVDQLSKRLRL